MNKESYRLSANVQKIDSECLQWFMAEQKISIRELARRTGNSHQTVNRWMKRGEMPAYLIEEICDALALESVCDMRENSVLKCAEPVTTFQWKDREDGELVKMHATITVEFSVEKELFEKVLKHAMNGDDSVDDLSFGDDTAEMIRAKGKAHGEHYISGDHLIEDAFRAGYVSGEKLRKLIFAQEDSNNENH